VIRSGDQVEREKTGRTPERPALFDCKDSARGLGKRICLLNFSLVAEDVSWETPEITYFWLPHLHAD